MGHKHSHEELLDAAVAEAFEHGLGNVTFGRVARRLGISDRVVVYYFPTKDHLIEEVLVALGLQVQAAVAAAFSEPAADHLGLAAAAWPILALPQIDPVFALYFEASGLAAAGREPYDRIVPLLVEAWVEWATQFLAGPPARRRREAEATIALLDGLLLVRQILGAAAADRAARALRVR